MESEEFKEDPDLKFNEEKALEDFLKDWKSNSANQTEFNIRDKRKFDVDDDIVLESKE